MDVLLFQVLQIAVTVPFLFFISFYRKKAGFKPLINKHWVHLVKISLLGVIVIGVYSLITLTATSAFNWVGFSCTIIGTVLVAKAKLDLAKSHAWAGFCMEKPKLVAGGIYSYVRHPLYVGIYLFNFGVMISLIVSSSWQLTIIAFLALVYMLSFLAVIAKKETNSLEKSLGEEFSDYKKNVHFCLPIRKYIKKKNGANSV